MWFSIFGLKTHETGSGVQRPISSSVSGGSKLKTANFGNTSDLLQPFGVSPPGLQPPEIPRRMLDAAGCGLRVTVASCSVASSTG